MFGIVASTRKAAEGTVGAVRRAGASAGGAHFADGPRSSFRVLLPDGTPGSFSWNEKRTACCAVVGEVLDPSAGSQEDASDGGGRADGAARRLLHQWEQRGARLIQNVSGLFAAAVWEVEAERLTLLCDWIGGIHHLHYAMTDDGLAFASDIYPLLQIEAWDGALSQAGLAQYLDFGHILPPNTVFQGIHKLAPGCALTYENGEVTVQRVFRLDFAPRSDGDWVEQFRDTHRRAIARCLSGPDEVGAFLSGGIDSSFNVAAMSELSEKPIKTFAVTYPGEDIDEAPYARLVAEAFGTDHHELALESSAVLDELPEMIWALGEPAMDYSFIPTFNLARFARQHVQVAVSGDGPDHLLGRHHPVALVRRTLGRLPWSGRLASVLLASDRSVRWKIAGWRRLRKSESGRFLWKALQSLDGDAVEAYLSIYREIAYRGLLPDGPRAMMDSTAAGVLDGAGVDAIVTDTLDGQPSEFERMIGLDLAIDGSFGVFAKVGKMAGYHDLQIREPYLDAEMCSLLEHVPSGLKVRGSAMDLVRNRARTKYLLYEAARGVVPDEVIRKPKQGFQAPIGRWLCDWLADRDAHALLPALARSTQWLNAGAVDRILREHREGRRDHSTLIMMLITLDLWHGIFVEGNADKPGWTWSEWLKQ
ncbi:MAG: asparagine synthase-related protein [Armatimonadota bacterium]|nr:asparagine synthase-related protein [Armatimonadota bacterium]